VEEIIVQGHVGSSFHILPRSGDQFTSDVELDIEKYVGFVIGRYKKFQIILIRGGDRFLRVLNSTEHRRLNESVRENMKFATK